MPPLQTGQYLAFALMKPGFCVSYHEVDTQMITSWHCHASFANVDELRQKEGSKLAGKQEYAKLVARDLYNFMYAQLWISEHQ